MKVKELQALPYYKKRKLKEEINKLTPEQKGDLIIKLLHDGANYKLLATLLDCQVIHIIEYLKQVNMKRCTKCGEIKTWNDFHKAKDKTDGFMNHCRECAHKKRKKIYHETQKNCEETKLQNYLWKDANRDKINVRRREINQTEEKKKKNRDYIRKRRQSNPIIRLCMNFSNLISYHLSQVTQNKVRKRNRHWEDIVGYTLEELKEHLELQFQDRMTWENYGQWHVDHIIPASSFNITSLECDEFLDCWALDNLQPLWAEDNIFKSNNLAY